MEPLVSIIIPVYNVLPYLQEALDSVINQTYKNLEILIVDDGSTDGSSEICDEYLSDPRVIVIHQENKGLSGARNTGLDRMTGEYVAFLDSDDAFMPEMIEKTLDALIINQADVAICGYSECHTEQAMNITDSSSQTLFVPEEKRKLTSCEALNVLVSTVAGWTVVWNKLYKRCLWDHLRFPEGYLYEDMHVTFRIFENCNNGVLPLQMPLVYYRRRNGSITKTQSIQNVRDALIAARKVQDFITAHTPDIFTPENAQSHLEIHARTISLQYACLCRKKNTRKELKQIRKEISKQWDALKGHHLKLQSSISRFLFLHAPNLIIPFGYCWRLGKSLFGKVVHS